MNRRSLLIGVLIAGTPIVHGACRAQAPAPPWGITAVEGITLGHHTLDDGMVAGVDVRGGAPGTHETELLDPVNTVERVHAVVLSGGSAFGLASTTGVMQYLDERDVGFSVGTKTVPIVVGAILATRDRNAHVALYADLEHESSLDAANAAGPSGTGWILPASRT